MDRRGPDRRKGRRRLSDARRGAAGAADQAGERRDPADARTAFLTGATGFIGGRLAARLAADGWRLRCLVRRPDRAQALRERGAELIIGDTTDAGAMRRGCDGADAAVHLAGTYRIGPVDERELHRVNVDGTRVFLDAVAREGLERAVHVSSTAVLPPEREGARADACDAWAIDHLPTAYQRTKAEAHELARTAQRHGLPLAIACPANVYGPGDEGPNGAFVRDLLRGRVPALVTEPAWFCYVHVDDIAAGLALLLDRGRMGECYIFGGEPESINGFAMRVANAAGVRPPPLRLPAALIAGPARLLDLIARLTSANLTISYESVRLASHERWLQDDRATRAALGWQPRGLEQGIRDMLGAEIS